MYQQTQLTSSIIMVRPHDFGFNEQTGFDNEYQHKPASEVEYLSIKSKALAEFESMVELLDKSGVEVLVLDKPEQSSTLPDAIFPNNWFSTRADGSLFIYPMKTPNRRAEVQIKNLKILLKQHNYYPEKIIDLRFGKTGEFNPAMEGTGSLIFHHPSANLFAALSERCNGKSLNLFARTYGYNVLPFESKSRECSSIYHSNVLMSCGEKFAVMTEEVLVKNSQAFNAMEKLTNLVKDVIIITEQQMAENFCGNILQLEDKKQQPVIVLSDSAYKGFTRSQIVTLEQHGTLIVCSIPTIEYVGGGSARCMLAENFLVKRT
ncbi:MAG: hypothetical protein COA74_03850 [Gammaproteobacteria bacterium]|nr:MAG: hypothetical protein COA74_03850 [Gammaproteobacteria bacterium]